MARSEQEVAHSQKKARKKSGRAPKRWLQKDDGGGTKPRGRKGDFPARQKAD